jgi:hypothetical protein
VDGWSQGPVRARGQMLRRNDYVSLSLKLDMQWGQAAATLLPSYYCITRCFTGCFSGSSFSLFDMVQLPARLAAV